MVQRASDTVEETRATMMDTIRENPIPAALVGIGLGWLFMNGGRRPTRYSGRGVPRTLPSSGSYPANQYGYTSSQQVRYGTGYPTGNTGYQQHDAGVVEQGQQVIGKAVDRVQDTAGNVADRVQETASNVADRVQETASNVADRASNLVDSAQSTASELADEAQYQARRVEDRFRRTLHENPLAVGAVALAVGAAVGLAIPETRAEHQLMGETRDQLVDKVQDVAQQTMGKVQETVQHVTEQAKDVVHQATDQAKDAAQGMAKEQGR